MATRDEFFWLGEINKATIVINSQEGLLSQEIAAKAAQGVREVLADGAKEGGPRPKTVITFEPQLLTKVGAEVTIIHAGRSSQDMHATYRAAVLRDNSIEVASELQAMMSTMTELAQRHENTVVPNYTNGVAAQPNSYAHYLLAFLAGFERDFQRLCEFYQRLDLCPMGSTVLNGSSWPLNRVRMASYLGFNGVADNAYDATQISQVDLPVEFATIVSSIALHIGSFLQDTMVQYAQPRPWILLQEGGDNTYVSSAMPQKRNPGLMNNTRTEASTVVGEAQTEIFRAHNLQSGMIDPKKCELNSPLAKRTCSMLKQFTRVLNALVINPDRALEELNNDWTASQEVADVLMRKYGLPFRIGHHVASHMVSYARANTILPLQFPYEEMQRIYGEVIREEYPEGSAVLPMSEEEFRSTLNPQAIVQNRKTQGGPQPAELTRMLKGRIENNASNQIWIESKKENIAQALTKLDTDFNAIN